MFKSAVFVVVVALAVVSAHAFGDYEVSDFAPSAAHFRGRDLITIKGVGFRTFSQVACIWNHEWTSFDSRIVDDNTIVCETPVIPVSEISGLPLTTVLDIVFDGDSDINTRITNSFVFGPALTSFSPTSGFVGGGNTFTVKGARFTDYESVQVLFDGKPCLSPFIRNDTDIVCVVPEGSFDQDAMVTVVFDNLEKAQLHFETTYHFGPVVNTIVPPCGNFQGGSRVSLLGNNFNDPIIAGSVPPVGALPVVEIVFNNRRYFGSGVTFDGSQIVFTTPFIDDNVFGKDVEIYVHFKNVNSKVTLAVTSFKFRYGPIVYNTAFPTPYLADPSSFKNPSPSSGHRAGGDIIAIDGCGFSNFTTANISPILDVAPVAREFCIRGPNGPGGAQDTLVITSCGIGCERMLCFSAPFDCDPNDVPNALSVQFRAPADRFQTSYVLPPVEEDGLSFKLGPVVSSISTTRGRWTGGQTVTVTGSNFFSNGLVSTAADPGWSVTAIFSSPSLDDDVTVSVTIVSDTRMTFVTPEMPFGTTASLSFNFDTTCDDLPRTPFTFFFGPSCNTITPANDILSGGRPVTISGVGFTEDGVSDSSNIEVRICIDRLNDAGDCENYEVPDTTTVSNNAIVFTPKSLRDGISTTVGGNRLFGEQTTINVIYDAVEDGPGVLECGSYRFGPVVNSISPQKGPIGPRAPSSPGTRVTVTGTAFNDPTYNQNIRVAIGSGKGGFIFQDNAKLDGFNDQTKDKRLTFSTIWGGQANNDVPVVNIFNTCNTTLSDYTVRWGPMITSVSGIDNAPINLVGNPNADVYGALPEGGQSVFVTGLGFSDFIVDEDDELAIRCLVDGVEVSTSYDLDDSPNVVECVLPPRPFNSVANITLEFGHICGDSFLPFDYLQSITASQRVFYRPRIIDISPDYGLTSGGQQVTFTGEGFVGWNTYVCYFGQYTNGLVASVNEAGTTVTCSTPYHRGEFNTDVSAHILLSSTTLDRKVISPVTYHYGPVCSEVIPSVAAIAGGNAANIVGDGFIDCEDSGPDSPFLNCTFVEIQVAFNYTEGKNNTVVFANNTGVTSTTVGFFAPGAANGCSERPIVSLYFPNVTVSDESRRYVQCTADDFVYHYGPLVTGYTSQFFRRNTAYGFTDTTVTITGLNLADASAGSPTCQFGNTTGTTVSVTDETVICSAPSNTWNTVVEVSLNYGNSCRSEDTVAGLFHYGPVVDSISPDFGYVAGNTPVTISGFAFGCCGISQYECMFPGFPGDFTYATTVTGNNAVCNVPENDRIDLLLNNVGVRFGGSFFNGNTSYQTVTEDGEVLRYYYGPIVTSITPDSVSLSGRGDSVTIIGGGFDDPYFDEEVLCDFDAQVAGGFDETTTASSVTFSNIVCPVATFSHRCGDFDNIRPRWGRSASLQQLRPEQGASYWKTAIPARSPAVNRLPFSSDGGSSRDQYYGPVVYGPEITSVTVVSGGVSPISSTADSLRVRVDGGVAIDVTFDDIQDWVDAGPENNFGTEQAWCLFGNRGSPALSPITFGSNTIRCIVPDGAWRFSGALSVILDPHFDSSTVLEPDSNANFWHWLPFATTISKNLAGPKGYESVVVTGAGFCQYDSVVCTFGNTQGVQADIVNDYRVVCQTPPAAPGVAPLSLTFCTNSDCSATADNTLNTITVSDSFTIVGIKNISPREGPRCGGTNITLSGAGFSLFNHLTCRFDRGEFEVPATVLSDSAISCITPDTTPDAITNPVSCIDVSVVGRFKDIGDIVFESPVTFEAGFPVVFASDPTSAWIEVKTEIVVIGEYFNGDNAQLQQGQYKCIFGDLEPILAEFYYFTEDDGELKTAIVCDTPTIFNNDQLKTGSVFLEIVFDCNDAIATVNRLPFTFFQRPDIDNFTPTEGPEVGGTIITVTGEHLAGGSGYFCSFGTFGIDNQIVSAVWDPVLATITCISPANVVSVNTNVDFAISVDGGNTFTRAEVPFQYENVARICDDNDAPGTNPNVPLVPINSSSFLVPSFLLTFFLFALSHLFFF